MFVAMKFIIRAALAGVISAGIFNALIRRLVAQQAAAYRRLGVADLPTVHPIADAEPFVEEPLEESDLRVAQNTPL
jgi:hypothetical protein